MKGLIYKDITIFFKGIDKKLVLIAAGAIILLMANTGVYAGLFASIMLAMTIGMQNVMCFASDEKAGWKKYQLAMPVNTVTVVTSKYVSVICTLPLLWTGICLPFTYWFGFRSAQTMGLIAVIPMFYLVKYFEDGAGFSAMTSSIRSYLVVAGVAAIVLYIISMLISVIGYNRKK